jgi:hypothetical protein
MISKIALTVISALGLWFAPIKGAFIFVILLVMVDTFTGVYSAYKQDKKSVTSNKAFQVVPKLIFYGLLIIIGQALSYYVDSTLPWVKLALAGIAWIEIKSIDENYKDIFGYSFINKIFQALNKIKTAQKKSE